MRHRRGFTRTRALLAGGLVFGLGSIATLAAWTDTEWVWGGASGNGENLGTSVFEMEQNAVDPAEWVQEEESPGNQLRFEVNATDLTPGTVVYAPLQLRVVAGSLGGDVTLDGAIAVTGTDQALFDALRYQVKTGVARPACNAEDFASGGAQLVPANSPLSTGSGATSFSLAAAPDAVTPGTAVDLCFELTLPDVPENHGLQGLTAQPAWAFQGIST